MPPATERLTSYRILVEAKRDSEVSKARAQVLGILRAYGKHGKKRGRVWTVPPMD